MAPGFACAGIMTGAMHLKPLMTMDYSKTNLHLSLSAPL